MKKFIVFLSLMAFFVYVSPVMSQEPVKMSEAERIVDKYLAKTGQIIDSTFTKVAPMAEKAFAAYSKGYEMRGTINFWFKIASFTLCLFMFLLCLFWEFHTENIFDDPTITAMMGIIFGVGLVISSIVLFITLGDSYVMMKAPEYYVIKDLIGSIT